MGIKRSIRKYLKKNLPDHYKDSLVKLLINKGTISYSQEGEDLILKRIFKDKKAGVYVDVGAHHPWFISNTYNFYLNNWQGINIDAAPGSIALFNKVRPRDINIETAIGNEEGEQDFYIFSSPELNTFSKENAEIFRTWPNTSLLQTVKINVQKLSTVLDKYMPSINTTEIDFFSIDVEGLDLEVLKSNDWQKYSPRVILVEELFSKVADVSSPINIFLREKGYELFAKTFNTCFYKRSDVEFAS